MYERVEYIGPFLFLAELLSEHMTCPEPLKTWSSLL